MAGIYVGNSDLPRGVHLWTQMGHLQTTSVAFPTSCFLFLGKRDHGIASMTVFKKVMQMITIVTQFIAYCVADVFFKEGLSLYHIKSLVLVHKWLDCFCLFPEMFSSLVSGTFSEVPLDHLIRFGVLMPPFPLFMLFLAVWSCWSDSLQSELVSMFSHAFFRHPQVSFPPSHMICSCSSVILAGSKVSAEVTAFLTLQLVGINRRCKRSHFRILLLSGLIVVLSSPVGGWGFGGISLSSS